MSGSKTLNPVARSFPWWLHQYQAESSTTKKNVFVTLVRSHDFVRKQCSFCVSYLSATGWNILFFLFSPHEFLAVCWNTVTIVSSRGIHTSEPSLYIMSTVIQSKQYLCISPVILVQECHFLGRFGIWRLSRPECLLNYVGAWWSTDILTQLISQFSLL